MHRGAVVLVLVGAIGFATGCPAPVSEDFPDDYTSWPDPITVRGSAPGHGDTIRVIYVNDIARAATSISPTYPVGSIIVKEIRDDDDGQPGDLRYLAIMRQISAPATALEDEGGWLFSQADTPGSEEVSFGFCWGRCHAAAPYNGAFYDYRHPTTP